ncbi:hypothetical protein BN871_AB_00560 [Paenibacillus sp. P22]|nr:hypothetical protein BN871_AB_00560 [Paenibacillus sp. P22]
MAGVTGYETGPPGILTRLRPLRARFSRADAALCRRVGPRLYASAAFGLRRLIF